MKLQGKKSSVTSLLKTLRPTSDGCHGWTFIKRQLEQIALYLIAEDTEAKL